MTKLQRERESKRLTLQASRLPNTPGSISVLWRLMKAEAVLDGAYDDVYDKARAKAAQARRDAAAQAAADRAVASIRLNPTSYWYAFDEVVRVPALSSISYPLRLRTSRYVGTISSSN